MSIVIFLILLIALWQGAYFLGVDVFHIWKPYSVPSPSGVGEKFIELLTDGSLMEAIGNSLLRGLAGYLIAVFIGVLLGLLINHFKYLQKNLKPIILGVQTLPSVCWVPFSILWFGLSTEAILFVVVMGANKKQLYTKVVFPAALPELVSGLKQGWSFAWRALMAGEVMTTSVGLGQTLITGRDLADINQVMLVMVIIVVIGIMIDKGIFSLVEKRLLKKRGLWNT